MAFGRLEKVSALWKVKENDEEASLDLRRRKEKTVERRKPRWRREERRNGAFWRDWRH